MPDAGGVNLLTDPDHCTFQFGIAWALVQLSQDLHIFTHRTKVRIIPGKHLLEHGISRLVRRVLRQILYPHIVADGDLSFIGSIQTCDNFQKG
ncbi:hypothetical protein D3C74_407160 [compost metagenome]